MSVNDSIDIAKAEISEVFQNRAETPENDTDDGFVGDVVGKCPLCGGNVIRTSFGYGCSEYKSNSCKFGINNVICSRVISISNVKQMLDTGRSYKINGFISQKSGKEFSSYLKLENGKIVFDFND